MRKRTILFIGITAFLILFSGCGGAFAETNAEGRIVKDFDFGWKFLKGDMKEAQRPDFDDARWRSVDLPHDWSIEGPYSQEWASGTAYLPGGIGWYRKRFTLEPAWKDKLVAIEFGGVYKNSEVWINGKYLGKRPFGYISFQYDLTPHVHFDQENVIAVKVDHSDFADSRWYTGSGIYRHVRLKVMDKMHIDHWGTFITTRQDLRQRSDQPARVNPYDVNIETTVRNEYAEKKDCTLILKVMTPSGKEERTFRKDLTLEPDGQLVFNQRIEVDNPLLWSVDSPNLYTLVSSIEYDGKLVDKTTTRFGIRTIRFDPDEGFFLNGKNMKLKGVCLHHDAGPLGAAVPEKVWRKRLESLKAIGCNAIRCSHNPPAPELLDLCDEMGFVVMDEAFDEFTPPKNKWVKGRNVGTPTHDGYGTVFTEWAIRDIQDMVRRDRNHPSIILWSIGNEVDFANDPFSHPSMGDQYKPDHPPAENLTKLGLPLVKAVKELDSTRPVTAALANVPVSNAVGFADILDVAGYNYQEQLYEEDHKKYPERNILGSENSKGFRQWQAVTDNDYISGQFLWTGIDYLGEAGEWPARSWTGGLFDLCGFKKPDAWFRQAMWSDEPMVYLSVRSRGFRRGQASHWNWPADSNVRVYAGTNCEEVTLQLNGKDLETQKAADAIGGMLRRQVPFEAGTLTAIGKNGGKEVCRYTLQTAGDAAKIQLAADTKTLAADGRDVCEIEFTVTDENGIIVPDADNKITFTVTGPAKILGIGNGDPTCHEDHQGTAYSVYQGRGLLIIQSKKEPGTIEINAAADGLKPATLKIETHS